jgi:hypothetical protein
LPPPRAARHAERIASMVEQILIGVWDLFMKWQSS